MSKIIDQVVADALSALLVVAASIRANGAQDGLTKTYEPQRTGARLARAAAGKHVIGVDMYAPTAGWPAHASMMPSPERRRLPTHG